MSSVFLCLCAASFLRQGLSGNQKFMASAVLAVQNAAGICCPLPVPGLQTSSAMPSYYVDAGHLNSGL